MITVSYDDSNGVIRTVTYGQTSRADIEAYIHRLLAAIECARRDWGRVLHLVDAGELELQSDENLRSLAGASIDVQEDAKDRTAVVMRSAQAIAQIESMPSQMGTMVFGDFKSAKGWLFAQSGEPGVLAA